MSKSVLLSRLFTIYMLVLKQINYLGLGRES